MLNEAEMKLTWGDTLLPQRLSEANEVERQREADSSGRKSENETVRVADWVECQKVGKDLKWSKDQICHLSFCAAIANASKCLRTKSVDWSNENLAQSRDVFIQSNAVATCLLRYRVVLPITRTYARCRSFLKIIFLRKDVFPTTIQQRIASSPCRISDSIVNAVHRLVH